MTERQPICNYMYMNSVSLRVLPELTYMDTLTEGYGWSGRQYVYVPRTVRVTVTYTDTQQRGSDSTVVHGRNM